ncbi:hypothetical protein RO575_08330 [Methylomonas sp. MO1]|uniref:hypothetical protein n=1 Tax=Methylomonas sp. MO1 TaxID=3073619 RepID=UPI0028A3B2A4|nr:hypothetical protein [Methylomonas sp. MO1]MDT4289563.1 hypothetical protein [Methylomonas sp. MO1]
MRPVKGSYNIVIVGAWNPSIFNPQWINKNLLTEGEEATIAFPLNDTSLPVQISIPNIKLYPSAQRLEIKPDNENSSGLEFAIDIGKKIATLLEHTPVSGIGFNFSFEDTDDIDTISSKFDLLDSTAIDANTYKLKQTIVQRIYELDSRQILNLSISYNMNSIRADFNFHFDVSNLSDVISILDEKTAIQRIAQATDFIKNVYEIDLDENNN